MPNLAILNGQDVVPITDTTVWGQQLFGPSSKRQVAKDVVKSVIISTIFMGINEAWADADLWFETLIVDTPHELYRERYSTWDQAVAGHARALALVKG